MYATNVIRLILKQNTIVNNSSRIVDPTYSISFKENPLEVFAEALNTTLSL